MNWLALNFLSQDYNHNHTTQIYLHQMTAQMRFTLAHKFPDTPARMRKSLFPDAPPV